VGVAYLAVAPGTPPRRHPQRGLDESHPFLGWFHVPDSTLRGRIVINSKGLREREYAYEPAPGVSRMLILGDGFTSAYEVALPQVWHEVLEESLLALRPAETGRRIEIIAAALPGWSTDQQLLYYRHEGYRYQPSVVLVQFVLDDLYGNNPDLYSATLKTRKPYFTIVPNGIELRNFPYVNPAPSRLRELTGRSINTVARILGRRGSQSGPDRPGRRGNQEAGQQACQADPGAAFIARDYAADQPPEYRTAWTMTRFLLREIAAEARRRGQRVAVVYIPERLQVSRRAWDAARSCFSGGDSVKWDLDLPNHTLGGILRQEGIPYLDLTTNFRDYGRATGRATHFSYTHLNLDGHRETARWVRAWLIERQLVP
jgi:hypothetical protein